MARMTKTSAENLQVADKVGYTTNEFGVMVWVERAGNRAYLCDASGPLVYETCEKAWRNIRRVRPDIKPTI